MILFLYNLLFPLVLLCFVPGIVYKLLTRGGHKKSFGERFGFFSKEAKERLAKLSHPIWIHAVSVGETQLAIDFIKRWLASDPSRQIVLSTTTTTGQELARSKAPSSVPVIFCPLDFSLAVGATLRLVRPSLLVIFETELWPNLITMTRRRGAKVVLVNARMSDRSHKGYLRAAWFLRPFLKDISLVCAQTDVDVQRYASVCPGLRIERTGTMKFDQPLPDKLPVVELDGVFGAAPRMVLLGASTHPGEERFMALTFLALKREFQSLRLIIVPRHAERGAEIAATLKELGIAYLRRSSGERQGGGSVDCLLADTTGELMSFFAAADIVVMGKSLAGNEGGHNVIEPALLGKPVVSGWGMTNFRFVRDALVAKDALVTVPSDSELEGALGRLLRSPEERQRIGGNARNAILEHCGATRKTIELLENIV